MADLCEGCVNDTQSTTTVSVPADTGPFLDVPFCADLRPVDRWDMPVCHEHHAELSRTVACGNCGVPLIAADAIHSSSGAAQCRPCYAKDM